MAEKIPNIAPLDYQYTFIEKKDIPSKYTLYSIDYRKDEVESFGVLFFHRLLRKNFGDPSVIKIYTPKLDSILPENCDYYFATKDGGLTLTSDVPLNINEIDLESAIRGAELREWEYYVRTKHNDVILIKTEQCHFMLSIYHVLFGDITEPNQKKKEEGEAFVDSLLREANRQLKGGQLYNLKAEFEKGDNIKHYLLHNVFLENYRTAVFLLQTSVEGEKEISENKLKYDASDPLVRVSKEKMKHIEHYLSIQGAYYSSSIMYFFMAFEGFINLLYHTFLRDEYRSEYEDISRRLDLEQKILFLPALCYGFKDELINDSNFLETFKQLKNFRNALIHAKMSDALSSVTFIEQGFVYSRPVTRKKDDMFPDHKVYLTLQNAVDFGKKIESQLEHIKSKMDDEHRELVDNFFMKDQYIHFRKDENNFRIVGRMENNDSPKV